MGSWIIFVTGLLITGGLDYGLWILLQPGNWITKLLTLVMICVLSIAGLGASIFAAKGFEEANA